MTSHASCFLKHQSPPPGITVPLQGNLILRQHILALGRGQVLEDAEGPPADVGSPMIQELKSPRGIQLRRVDSAGFELIEQHQRSFRLRKQCFQCRPTCGSREIRPMISQVNSLPRAVNGRRPRGLRRVSPPRPLHRETVIATPARRSSNRLAGSANSLKPLGRVTCFSTSQSRHAVQKTL